MDAVTRVEQGVVQGSVEHGVAVFRGVPYAAPPFGSLRFAPPQPPTAWSGVRDCTAFGPTAPKPPYPGVVRDLLPEVDIEGTDCLNLNVWTPDPQATGLPVFVWIHGGAFVNGSGSVPQYDAAAFARDGVVGVTVNYRLGVDGFAHLDGAVDNRGLLDQIAALRWVRDNIAAFGGDPAAVTIGGESAGAMSVCSLIAMPAARGLFHRAVAQSGAGHHVLQPATAGRVSAALAEALGVAATTEGLGGVELDALLAAQVRVSELIGSTPDPARWGEITANMMPFEPVVDGTTLAGRPIDVVTAGDGADVDLLIGTNDDEHALFLVPNGLIDAVDEPTVRFVLQSLGAPEDAYDTYVGCTTDPSAGAILVAALSDWFFRVPALRMAVARTALGRRTHVYEFGWRSSALGGRLGACHALEIAFVFDTLADPSGAALAGDQPPQALADDMHAAWVRFVRDGDPGWPAYGPARSTRRFGGDGDGEVRDDPAPERRAVWAGR